VFRQKADQEYKENGNAKAVFLRTAKILLAIMIVPCIVVAVGGPWIFKILFGAEWQSAGVYAQILIIMMLPKFIASPLSYMYIIARKQKEDFWIHIYILISTFFSFYLGYKLYGTSVMMLTFFCINYAFIYMLYFYRSYIFASGKNKTQTISIQKNN
jgi:O-antigen/teichoic acid export membrane protein